MSPTRTLAAAATLAVAAGGVGTAVAAKPKPTPSKVTIKAFDKTSYKINRGVVSTMRFDKDVYKIKSGGTLTLKQGSKQEPHTFSFVKPTVKLPRTAKQFDACGQGQGICGPIGAAHQFNPATGQVGKPIVDSGKAGLDTGFTLKSAGDSVYIDPAGKSVKLKVSAAKGKSFKLFCAVHPWMQAKVLVK